LGSRLPRPHAIFSGIVDSRNSADSDLALLLSDSVEKCDSDVGSNSDDEDANDAGTMISLFSVYSVSPSSSQ
jgi:hypothetical protein